MNANLLFRLLFFVTLVSFTLSACGASTQQPLSPRLQEIRERGELVVGTALTAPFEFHDPQTGELIGLDVELAKTIAARIGVPIVWKEMAFADLIPALQAGKMDLAIAGMYITEKRKELVDMSDGYVDTGLVVVARADSPDVADFKALTGKIVCVKTGATGAIFAQKALEDGVAVVIHEYSDTVSSLEDLSAGYCDAALNDKINSIEYIKTHPDLKVASEILQPAQFGIAVQKGDAELLAFVNETIAAMKADGRLAKLYDTWALGK